jgi:drug/metabolite transporter (DMT)-like permease
MEKWFIFALLGGVFSTTFNYINRYYLRDHGDAASYAWLFELTRTLLFFPLVFLNVPNQFTLNLILILLALGFIEFFSSYIYMKMHAYAHLSISTIVTRLRLVWVPILAFIFLSESLPAKDYVGIAIVFFGQSIIVSPRRFFFDRGVQFSFLSSITTSFLSLVMKKASELASTPLITISMGLPTIFLYPFVMKSWKVRITSLWKKNKFPICIATLFNALAMYFLIWALRIGDVSRVTAVYQTGMLFGVFVGIVSLKEREDIIKKILGVVITILGISLFT